MSASIIMPIRGVGAPLSVRVAHDIAAPRAVAHLRAGGNVHRLDSGIVVLLGFVAAMGWALFGSLVLGLGTGSASRPAAWLWLAGEMLIGATVFLALLLGAPPGPGEGG